MTSTASVSWAPLPRLRQTTYEYAGLTPFRVQDSNYVFAERIGELATRVGDAFLLSML
jgi:hypothetical protein